METGQKQRKTHTSREKQPFQEVEVDRTAEDPNTPGGRAVQGRSSSGAVTMRGLPALLCLLAVLAGVGSAAETGVLEFLVRV